MVCCEQALNTSEARTTLIYQPSYQGSASLKSIYLVLHYRTLMDADDVMNDELGPNTDLDVKRGSRSTYLCDTERDAKVRFYLVIYNIRVLPSFSATEYYNL